MVTDNESLFGHDSMPNDSFLNNPLDSFTLLDNFTIIENTNFINTFTTATDNPLSIGNSDNSCMNEEDTLSETNSSRMLKIVILIPLFSETFSYLCPKIQTILAKNRWYCNFVILEEKDLESFTKRNHVDLIITDQFHYKNITHSYSIITSFMNIPMEIVNQSFSL